MVGYHHIVWKQILELPLKYFQNVYKSAQKTVPTTYSQFLQMAPNYSEKKQIEELIGWIAEYDGLSDRFDLAGKDQSSGDQGKNAENYMGKKLFEELINKKLQGYETEGIVSVIIQDIKNNDQRQDHKDDLFFDSRCILPAATPRKTPQDFANIKNKARERLISCLLLIKKMANPLFINP